MFQLMIGQAASSGLDSGACQIRTFSRACRLGPHKICRNRLLDRMPSKKSEYMPDGTPENISDIMPAAMSNNLQDKKVVMYVIIHVEENARTDVKQNAREISAHLPGRTWEDLSDIMPKYQIKCQNLLVTRSHSIFQTNVRIYVRSTVR